MANTISSRTYRDKYRQATLAKLLRKSLVAEAICEVDRGDAKTIDNPYGSQPTTVLQALAGTYTPAEYTTTDDTLTVAYEFIIAEHIYDFEKVLTKFNLFENRMDEMNNSIKTTIDQYVVNSLCADGTGAYTAAAGGFTSAGNINKIMADLLGKVAGYADSMKGLFLVIENTDVSGFTQAQATNGYSVADSALKNGFMDSYMGVDIYVVRTGTFTDTDLGNMTANNADHRVFGVKDVATYAAPRDIQVEEKGVSGKTGKELVTYGYIGFKLWAPKVSLVVDIDVSA
jgi:hypothetical protein